MSTLHINRIFSVATAAPGDLVDVITELSFTSPAEPNIDIWFNNFADNLGGSSITNGPLNMISSGPPTVFTNITPSTAVFQWEGAAGAQGCLRCWTAGGPYPVPTAPISNNWLPISPSTLSRIAFLTTYEVTLNATVGTVIGIPQLFVPTNNANQLAETVMLDFGQAFTVNIDSAEPEVGSRTLTIIAQPCFAADSLVSVVSEDRIVSSRADSLRPNSILVDNTGEKVRLSYAVLFEQPAQSLIRIAKGSFGATKNLLLCRGHPLLIGGQVVNAEDLLGSKGVDQVKPKKGQPICTLITAKRAFINVQGIFVGTWSQEAWDNALETDARFKNLQWSRVN